MVFVARTKRFTWLQMVKPQRYLLFCLSCLEILCTTQITILLYGKCGASGATYTRWGRSSCPGNGTHLIYTGYAGGSLYTDTGGAAEYVCMPKDPVFEFNDFHDTDGRIYGTQYETNFFGSTTSGDRALCSICRSSNRASVLMLPGQRSCNAGWTVEYHGIMATGYHDHKGRSQYICLDVDAESQPTMNSYDVGKVLYRVRSKCGSLPCPPFVDGNILSCVVCTK